MGCRFERIDSVRSGMSNGFAVMTSYICQERSDGQSTTPYSNRLTAISSEFSSSKGHRRAVQLSAKNLFGSFGYVAVKQNGSTRRCRTSHNMSCDVILLDGKVAATSAFCTNLSAICKQLLCTGRYSSPYLRCPSLKMLLREHISTFKSEFRRWNIGPVPYL